MRNKAAESPLTIANNEDGGHGLVGMRERAPLFGGELRQEGQGDDSVAPAPGLGDLDLLVSQVAEAGIPVEVRVEGTALRCPGASTCRPTGSCRRR